MKRSNSLKSVGCKLTYAGPPPEAAKQSQSKNLLLGGAHQREYARRRGLAGSWARARSCRPLQSCHRVTDGSADKGAAAKFKDMLLTPGIHG